MEWGKIENAIKHIPTEQLETLDYFKGRGRFFVERALVDDEQGNDERKFSDVMKQFNERQGGVKTLVNDCETKEEVAYTIFQWLTTNVGKSVLSDALKATGKKIVDVEAK
jgi:hypothetical protein